MINMKKTISAILAIAMILTLGVTAQARLVGDVTKDGTVNSADAALIYAHWNGRFHIGETR